MSTLIKPELSKKNKYYINRHRYYELKHFVMEYPHWKELYNEAEGYISSHPEFKMNCQKSDPTYKVAEKRSRYGRYLYVIERSAELCSEELGSTILYAIIHNNTYEHLLTQGRLYCSRNEYYETYRKFFWILDSLRD